MKGSRRRARTIAMQALYEIDATGHDSGLVISRLLDAGKLSTENARFVRELVNGVLDNKDTIDGYIGQFAPSWPVEQISLIDRNIIRLAMFEILLDNKTPVKVAIDEAVELAKSFGSDGSSRFINGVLGSVSTLAGNNSTRT